ncbi:hypothetical protein NC652_025276 [Populus alba x Populus x berolinensis]|uniref:Uncharacterized protein n=1 Tax=Populus alba x Populus x berolinensis TaxID=444605 RepID=A0AAD6MA97_9ROSI|nr:hypothetical protein NC652_025276 [Populus alba x Populus x berolinensis]KAJ6981627.1 hypothetical protein NC653_024890 [Populus alba x Populus x berolinensis]
MMEVKRPDYDQERVLWTPPPFTITVGSNPHMLISFTILLFLGVLLTILVYQFVFLTVPIKQKNSLKKGLIDVVHAQLLWSATVKEKNKKIKQ